MRLLQKWNPLPRTSNFYRWDQPTTRQIGHHKEHAHMERLKKIKQFVGLTGYYRKTPKEKIMCWFQKSLWITTAGHNRRKIQRSDSIHPLPKIDEMYAKLRGAKVFSTIDLRSGYHHIALGKDSRAKTAFVTPFGKYKFLMVTFGLAQNPAYF